MIDLQEIIDYYGLDKKIIALVLFPDLNNPEHALWRSLKTASSPANRKDLTLEQAYVLAEFLGVTIDDLFAVSQWKLVPGKEKKRLDIISFKRRDFIITLNLKTGISNIIHKDNILISEKILVGDFIGIQTFLRTADKLIDILLTKNQKTNA